MFSSSLPPVVCSSDHVLFTFVCLFANSGVQHRLCCVFVLANVLNDISNFETGQISVQNNSHTVAFTNTPTLNTFRIPGIQIIII
jgi:hypothetical protein